MVGSITTHVYSSLARTTDATGTYCLRLLVMDVPKDPTSISRSPSSSTAGFFQTPPKPQNQLIEGCALSRVFKRRYCLSLSKVDQGYCEALFGDAPLFDILLLHLHI